MASLAIVHYYGRPGVAKDYNKAFYWYNKADKAGYLPAKYMVAECYEYGRGVEMNKTKAKNIYFDLYRNHDDKAAYRAYLRLD